MSRTRPTSTGRAAAGMGAIALASRMLGFVRVLVVAAVLGTTFLGNAFQSANSVSNVLFELLAAGALSAVLVPSLVQLLEGDDQPGAERVAGGVLGVALAAMGMIAAAGVVFAPLLARLLTIGVPASVAGEQRELVTFLLRWFVPQIVLYAAGTVAIAALHSQRRFMAAAAAPMANTVVMVVLLVVFRVVAGPTPSLELTSGERWLLVAAGTGGVLAFVGCLLLACEASGFRLRPRWPAGDPRVPAVLRLSGWGVVLHTGAGILLGSAIVVGAAVEGGVVAYQVAWVFFLGPYAVLAQPLHTAILPELVGEVGEPGREQFRRSVQWALERMAVLVLPVSAAMVALALPAMRFVAFGESAHGGAPLLAAALASLAVGLLPYSAFLLLSRAFYALGDSRTPGTVAVVTAVGGAALMIVGGVVTEGTALLAVLGGAHSAAYTVGAIVLAVRLAPGMHGPVRLGMLVRMTLVAVLAGTAAWLASQPFLDGAGRVDDLLAMGAGLVAGTAVGFIAFLVLGVRRAMITRSAPRPVATDEDVALDLVNDPEVLA